MRLHKAGLAKSHDASWAHQMSGGILFRPSFFTFGAGVAVVWAGTPAALADSVMVGALGTPLAGAVASPMLVITLALPKTPIGRTGEGEGSEPGQGHGICRMAWRQDCASGPWWELGPCLQSEELGPSGWLAGNWFGG